MLSVKRTSVFELGCEAVRLGDSGLYEAKVVAEVQCVYQDEAHMCVYRVLTSITLGV